MNRKLIIFTDLDGTLLDENYSYKKALPALTVLQEKNIPLILCSSKTRAEIEKLRRKIGNGFPFISENGGGIFIPLSEKELIIESRELPVEQTGGYCLVRLGASYSDLRHTLKELRAEGLRVKGFGDMTLQETASFTGLSMADAGLARRREFDEPFIIVQPVPADGTAEDNVYEDIVNKVKNRIKAKGYNFTQGEFFHIMGESDKGRAVRILTEQYRRQYGGIVTAALGDSPNDIEMLRSVDLPVVVQKRDGSYDKRIRVKGLIRAEGIGPEGWNRAVMEMLNKVN